MAVLLQANVRIKFLDPKSGYVRPRFVQKKKTKKNKKTKTKKETKSFSLYPACISSRTKTGIAFGIPPRTSFAVGVYTLVRDGTRVTAGYIRQFELHQSAT